jgi:hypothetical protein
MACPICHHDPCGFFGPCDCCGHIRARPQWDLPKREPIILKEKGEEVDDDHRD